MLPRLMAEESLTAASRMAVGAGHLKAADRRRIVRDWEGLVDGGKSGRVSGPIFPRFQG